jgi:hypothetical protein
MVHVHFGESSDTVELKLGSTGKLLSFKLNEKDITSFFQHTNISIMPGSIVPEFVLIPKKGQPIGERFSRGFRLGGEYLFDSMERIISGISRKNQSKESVRKLMFQIGTS